MLKNIAYSFILIINIGCSSSSSESASNQEDLIITASYNESVHSYEHMTFTVSSNFNCNFLLSLDAAQWLRSDDFRTFTFRAPLTMQSHQEYDIKVQTQISSTCPYKETIFPLTVSRADPLLKFVPDPPPFNELQTQSNFMGSHALGFGGIEITETFTATICYPTPEDCETFENELFGQDAHNMAIGDFNNDGLEDLVIAWAIFPHTIELEQKIDAPIEIYLNDGNGRLVEDLSIYSEGQPPEHPFAYRLVVADFNNDGVDDVFAGSMGLQYRDPDYGNNFILPYPDLLLLSDSNGKFYDASHHINDQNNGEGKLCGFSHDASAGDIDNDGDIDIFACGIVMINDGFGYFHFHPDLNRSLQALYGNPMSSLVTDLNNDEYDDLIFWNFDNRNLEVNPAEGFALVSDGSKNILSWSLIELPVGPFGLNRNKYNHAAAHDLDQDGNMDIVVAITRDEPYYEGAYLQILMGDGSGSLTDESTSRFSNQIREAQHHGEGNLYLRDFDADGDIDIFHSTRDYQSQINGSHIALNDGSGFFQSIEDSVFPKRPVPNEFFSYRAIAKGVPINLDNEGCLDLIAASDIWDTPDMTSNYLYILISKGCN